MRVAVLGAGYVGCLTGASLAALGHTVELVDIARAKVDAINSGRSPVREPGLSELIARLVREKKLSATDSGKDACSRADIAVVCVGTPLGERGDVDVRAVQTVLNRIADAVSGRDTVMPVAVRSTISPHRLREVIAEVEAAHPEPRVSFVCNPEFLREATGLSDFTHPPFIIAGGDDAGAVERVLSLYDGVDAPRFATTLETAAMVKYACNAFHALKICFANEMAALATVAGADPLELMEVVASDTKLNASAAYLKPGFAFGGSCLPKDVRAMAALGQQRNQPAHLFHAITESNAHRLKQGLDTILAGPGRRLAFLGVTFKAGTDDLRESPYVELARGLIDAGRDLSIYDSDLEPEAIAGVNKSFVDARLPNLAELLKTDLDAVLSDADGVVLCKRVAPLEQIVAAVKEGTPIYDVEYLAARSDVDVPSAVDMVKGAP